MKQAVVLAIIFFVCVVGAFSGIGFVIKVGLGWKNEVGRISTEAVTSAVVLFGYLYWRARFCGVAKRVPIVLWPVLGWALLGLLFSVIPYFALQNIVLLRLGNFQPSLVISAAVFSVSTAIIEEIIFRDILLRAMAARYHIGICLATQVIFFTGIHFFSVEFDWFAVASLATSAMLFSMLWLLTGDFIAPMVAHFILNFTIFIFHGVFRPFVNHPGLLSLNGVPGLGLWRLAFELAALGLVCWIWYKAGKPTSAGSPS